MSIDLAEIERGLRERGGLGMGILTDAEVNAILDELSRLREVERRAKELANSFYVFTIEDDDGIRLSTGGMVVAHYSEHSPEGIALLKLDAAARTLSEREGQE